MRRDALIPAGGHGPARTELEISLTAGQSFAVPPQPPRKPQPTAQEWLVLHERGVIDGVELRQQLGLDGTAAA